MLIIQPLQEMTSAIQYKNSFKNIKVQTRYFFYIHFSIELTLLGIFT